MEIAGCHPGSSGINYKNVIVENFIDSGFPVCHYVRARNSIKELFQDTGVCGIYILHFINGEYYVGQAKNVINRYSAHRKKHLDIDYVSFREVDPADLNRVEKEMISHLEKQNKSLRNISLVSIFPGQSDLDLVISREDQDKWLQYKLDKDSLLTPRFDYPELRKKYTERFQALRTSIYYEPIRNVIQQYILYTLPFPRTTEYSFWSLTCLTKVNNSMALCRVNIFWQETLNITEYSYTYDGRKLRDLTVSIFMCKSKLLEKIEVEELKNLFPTLEFTELVYEKGGTDQINAVMSIQVFEDFLYHAPVSDAIKEFNLRLMRKGGCVYNRYHCFDFADEVLSLEKTGFE